MPNEKASIGAGSLTKNYSRRIPTSENRLVNGTGPYADLQRMFAMNDDELEILRGMWAECADDLVQWAKAFAPYDPGSEYVVRLLAEEMLRRLAEAKITPKV